MRRGLWPRRLRGWLLASVAVVAGWLLAIVAVVAVWLLAIAAVVAGWPRVHLRSKPCGQGSRPDARVRRQRLLLRLRQGARARR